MSVRSPDERSSSVLASRYVQLEEVLTSAGAHVPHDVLQGVEAHLSVVRERLALGVDHTVVALLGGTGSGKSSLFNRLSGIAFAEVSAKRPTTSQPVSCTWGEPADQLLDRLGVPPQRRHQRESELDADTEAALRGLVLVDLPDHDSVEAGHRDIVDTVVPLADLLVWVVDPQKYADSAVHTRYLSKLVGHERSIVVVLNQIDTVPPAALPELLADVKKVIADDGLADVQVWGVSATTGTGIAELRAVLADIVAARSAAAQRAAADLRSAAQLLREVVADGEPVRSDLPTAAISQQIADAVDLPERESQLRLQLRSGRAPQLPATKLAPERVEAVRSQFVAAAGDGLPPRWRNAIDRAVQPAPDLATDLAASVDAVPLPPAPRAARRVGNVLTTIFLALAVLVALRGVLLLADISWSWLPAVPTWSIPWLSNALEPSGNRALAVPIVLCLVFVLLWIVGRIVTNRVVARAAGNLARQHTTAVRTELDALLGERVVAPAVAVLAQHKQVREAIDRAASDLPVAPTATLEAPGDLA